LRKALTEAKAEIVLLDGIGVARLVLPLLQNIPQVRAKVLFHGKTRLNSSDIRLLRMLPAERLTSRPCRIRWLNRWSMTWVGRCRPCAWRLIRWRSSSRC